MPIKLVCRLQDFAHSYVVLIIHWFYRITNIYGFEYFPLQEALQTFRNGCKQIIRSFKFLTKTT